MVPRAAALRPLRRGLLSLQRPAAYQQQVRRYTSEQKQPSPSVSFTHTHPTPSYNSHGTCVSQGEFYKTFGRPVAKCLLLAMFTYQLVFWGWTKLEQDEIKAERQAEISKLEAQVKVLQEDATSAGVDTVKKL
ncbi:hypothetical protein B0T17DRAFT_515794 [Bombardia bombarda]|uniref:Inner membrane assembly complex subunit 17 n=1 Tax=Bombardia bombarda TaxID=252184 RepID=A0AA39XKD5_9PEZI|nr:hypothetical protein B0T17DRAFT_515794 [Bombardia bombarda]